MKSNFKHLYEIQVGNVHKIALIVILCLFVFSNSNASDYYVDNIGGNNANNGNSTGSAWFDFTNINARTFLPGDHIFLKSGCVWNSELRLKGSGTSSNFIVLDSYGTGNKPKIQRSGQVNDRTVFLENMSYFKLRNLEVCNAGDGVRLNYTIKGQTSVYFENLYIHNIDLIVNASPSSTDNVYYSTGILINSAVSKPTSVNDYVAADIRITNCEIAFTTAPITFLHVFNNPTSANNESPWSFKNVLIDNNKLHDFKGPISSRDFNNSKICNNICVNGGTSALPQGTTGFFNWNLENVVFEGNIMDGIPNTNSPDQTWIDNEGYCNNVQLYGNLIKNTAGSGIEFLALGGGSPPRGADDYNTNNVVDGNTFSNNGSGALKLIGTAPAIPSGTAKNNIYQPGNTFFNGTSSGFTLSNNNASSQNSSNLSLYKSYIASSNWDNSQRASKAFDGSASSNWQSASGSFANQWLRINFGASTTFDKIILSEYGNRTSGFRIEYSNDGITWQIAHTGTTIGTSKTVNFTPVTGKMARIYFTNGIDTPIIFEFEIYTTTTTGGNNLASNKTYNSSSNWDASQTAVKGFDGNYTTNWQSANETGFANQWLQVDFGVATVFDKVILSEYGDRTTGYRIEYSTNGTTWQTANTGTTIGTTKTVTFSPVTGNYARIFYTSGANTPIVFEFEVYNSSGSVTGGTNFIQNPSFDVDNFDTQNPTSWSTWTSTGTNYDADYTQNINMPRTGARHLAHWRNGNYDVYTYQNVAGLSNGTYTATVWAKTFGLSSTCYIKAQGYGGADIITNISGGTYTQYSISNIQVTNGSCTIGVYTAGSSGSATVFDDFVLTKNVVSATRIAAEGSDERFGFEVYPNPSGDIVNVSYNLPPNSEAELSVFDMMGKTIKQINFTSANDTSGKISVDVSRFKNGVYFINIDSDGKSFTKKVIVEK